MRAARTSPWLSRYQKLSCKVMLRCKVHNGLHPEGEAK
jgi:hypothetical protein